MVDCDCLKFNFLEDDIRMAFVVPQFPESEAIDFYLPVDFSSIGLNFRLRKNNFNFLTDASYETLVDNMLDVDDRQLRLKEKTVDGEVKRVLCVENFERNKISRVTFSDNFTYVVRRYIGGGTFGAVGEVDEYRVNDDGSLTLTRSGLSLKRQEIEPSDDQPANLLPAIKEAMIHYILYSKTADAAGESAYVPNFYKIGVQRYESDGPRGNVIYFITERMTDTLLNFLYTTVNKNRQARRIFEFYNEVVYKLSSLFEAFSYNHGDFKDDNIMFNDAGTYKLIDFGFSRMYLKDSDGGDHLITTSKYNKKCDPSRDLTQMTYNIRLTAGMPDAGAYETAGLQKNLKTLLNHILQSRCAGDYKNHAGADHNVDLAAFEWGNTYEHFNKHTNIYGDYIQFHKYLYWLTDPAGAQSAAPIPPVGAIPLPAPPPPPPPPAAAAAAEDGPGLPRSRRRLGIGDPAVVAAMEAVPVARPVRPRLALGIGMVAAEAAPAAAPVVGPGSAGVGHGIAPPPPPEGGGLIDTAGSVAAELFVGIAAYLGWTGGSRRFKRKTRKNRKHKKNGNSKGR